MTQVNIGDEKYRLSIFGHHIEVTKTLRDYIQNKLHKVEHFTDLLIDVVVRLDLQRIDHRCEVVMKFSHFKIVVHATTTDMYASIDLAFRKLESQLRRWKGRIQQYHEKLPQEPSIESVPVDVLERKQQELDDINDQIEEENIKEIEHEWPLPSVVKTKTIPLKILRLDEAIMKMELSHDNFLMYRGEEDRKLKVIYRRRDGSYGIISAEEKAVS